jgi:hypothetical protein
LKWTCWSDNIYFQIGNCIISTTWDVSYIKFRGEIQSLSRYIFNLHCGRQPCNVIGTHHDWMKCEKLTNCFCKENPKLWKKKDFVTIFSENYVNNRNLKDKKSGVSNGILHCYKRFSHPSKLLKKPECTASLEILQIMQFQNPSFDNLDDFTSI